jgi:hypothetical protein
LNASNTTAHIARGIMLKAAVNNLPGSAPESAKEWQAWRTWQAGTSKACADFAEKEAYDLFDRVLNAGI